MPAGSTSPGASYSRSHRCTGLPGDGHLLRLQQFHDRGRHHPARAAAVLHRYAGGHLVPVGRGCMRPRCGKGGDSHRGRDATICLVSGVRRRVAVIRDLGGAAAGGRAGCPGSLGLVYLRPPARGHDGGRAMAGAAARGRGVGRGRRRDSRPGRRWLRADRL